MELKARISLVFFLVMTLTLSGRLTSAQEAGSGKVNINTATQEELTRLPGMTKRKAAKVISGRPYASIDDLSKSGLTSKQIDKIKPLITFEGGPASPATATTGQPSTANSKHWRNTQSAASTQSTSTESARVQTPPQPGMVWVNPKSKIYHVEGDRYYGKTKNGQWMTEADAIKAGYRKSKQHARND
jgi:Helix-hairpin-helix motif